MNKNKRKVKNRVELFEVGPKYLVDPDRFFEGKIEALGKKGVIRCLKKEVGRDALVFIGNKNLILKKIKYRGKTKVYIDSGYDFGAMVVNFQGEAVIKCYKEYVGDKVLVFIGNEHMVSKPKMTKDWEELGEILEFNHEMSEDCCSDEPPHRKGRKGHGAEYEDM